MAGLQNGGAGGIFDTLFLMVMRRSENATKRHGATGMLLVHEIYDPAVPRCN